MDVTNTNNQHSSITLRHYQNVAPHVIGYVRRTKTKHPVVGLPTGSGKTYAMADLIKQVREQFGTQALIISHVKEILEQNEASFNKYLGSKVAVYSAGMGRREIGPITVAGIQSIYRRPEDFKGHNLIIIDECHTVSPEADTMYRKFLAGIGKHICVGFTATPFRLGTGPIYGSGQLFDDLIIDWCTGDRYDQLVKEGHLSPLTMRRTQLEMDVSDIKITGGDFNEKELALKFNRDAVTQEAIKEVLAAGKHRKKWLIFAIDIAHAESIAETLIRAGIKCAPVHSKMSESGFDRHSTVRKLKDGKYQAAVTVNVLTTGFDDPHIDLICLLRPTKSPVLHVQSLGRGSRVADGKENCLVLDFASNCSRLGPINDPLVLIKGKGKGGGDPVMKACENCDSLAHIAVRICPECGQKFPIQHGLSTTAIQIELEGGPKWLKVDSVEYSKDIHFGSPNRLKVTYFCQGMSFQEYVCIEHKGYAKHKADHWVKFRGGEPTNSVDDLMRQTIDLTKPKRIQVKKSGKHNIINDVYF